MAVSELVMNYTINPFWERLKKIGNAFVKSRERHGRAVAAAHLAAMGYHEEARDLMIYNEK